MDNFILDKNGIQTFICDKVKSNNRLGTLSFGKFYDNESEEWHHGFYVDFKEDEECYGVYDADGNVWFMRVEE